MSISVSQFLLAAFTLVAPVLIGLYRAVPYWWAIAGASTFAVAIILSLDEVRQDSPWHFTSLLPVVLIVWACAFDGGTLSRSHAVDSKLAPPLVEQAADRQAVSEILELVVGYVFDLPSDAERHRVANELYSRDLQSVAADQAQHLQITALLAVLLMVSAASRCALLRADFWSWLNSRNVRHARTMQASMLRNANELLAAYPETACRSHQAILTYLREINEFLDERNRGRTPAR